MFPVVADGTPRYTRRIKIAPFIQDQTFLNFIDWRLLERPER
jgi:hypothetical protein